MITAGGPGPTHPSPTHPTGPAGPGPSGPAGPHPPSPPSGPPRGSHNAARTPRAFWLGEITYADILTRRRYARSFTGWKTAMADLIEATMPVRAFRDLGRQCTEYRREVSR